MPVCSELKNNLFQNLQVITLAIVKNFALTKKFSLYIVYDQNNLFGLGSDTKTETGKLAETFDRYRN